MSEWFESWFGEEYAALYPHRNDSEAQRAVTLIANNLGSRPVRRVLDLACGSGRHARYLGARWWTSGVDLSEVMLRMAKRGNVPAQLVRADIRELPYRDASFDLIVNLFTSFGYFETDAEHDKVMCDVARLTNPGGTFVLDFFNVAEIKRSLEPYDDDASVSGGRVVQRREITDDGRFVVKHIAIKEEGKEFVERVRLFTKDELVAMLRRAGFSIEATYGDYGGEPFADRSPRVILFARRA